MTEKIYELESLSDVSDDIELKWVLGPLASLLKIPKKRLRKVFNIIKNPNLEAVVKEKKGVVKRYFTFGFRSFTIPKKNGGERKILAPHPDLQKIFEAVKDWLEKAAQAHKNAYGCVKERNPKKAVQSLLINEHFPLLANRHFFRFDIEDAFPSITQETVMALFESLDVQKTLAEILARLVTYDYDGARRLPQGSSCSPIILNLVYRSMCEKINKVCQKHDLNWIVFVDDFHFAGLDIPKEIKNKLLAVPPKYGFAIKPEKIKSNLGKTIPHVLGLTNVEGSIHIRRKLKKKYRRILYAAMTGEYSERRTEGIAGGAIKQIYGNIENWPGWLRKPYLQYRAERR